MPLIFMDRYTPEICRKHPDWLFVFGDNIRQVGSAGQACIRGMPNSYGIPTKHAPGMGDEDFFSDRDWFSSCEDDSDGRPLFVYFDSRPLFAYVVEKFCELEDCLENGHTVVWPNDNIGTGLAQLSQRAPVIWAYYQYRLARLIHLGAV